MRWSGSSYIGDGHKRQSPPFVRAIALAGLVLSLGGCAQLGLPFVEAGSRQAVDRTATGATRVSVKVSDGVDPSDWEAVRRALATAPDGYAPGIGWSNPDTGSDGTLSASAAVAGKGGTLCRTIETTINDNRGARRYRGEACQRTNGRWQIVKVAPDDATLS
jgi:surface antigen